MLIHCWNSFSEVSLGWGGVERVNEVVRSCLLGWGGVWLLFFWVGVGLIEVGVLVLVRRRLFIGEVVIMAMFLGLLLLLVLFLLFLLLVIMGLVLLIFLLLLFLLLLLLLILLLLLTLLAFLLLLLL